MELVWPFVPAALANRIEVGTVLAAEAQDKALALDVELSRPLEPHSESIVGLGAAVNLLCLRAS
jgi:hypothetical protein